MSGGTTIDGYLASLAAPWPQSPASAVVAAIRSAGPLEESIKWGHPFFSLRGRAVVKVFTAREWIDVFFYRGADLLDPEGLLGFEGRSAMRRLQIGRDADTPRGLAALVREAVSAANAAKLN